MKQPIILSLLLIYTACQVNPTWIATAFMTAGTALIVNDNQKLKGIYNFAITFPSIYPTPEIVLCTYKTFIVFYC